MDRFDGYALGKKVVMPSSGAEETNTGVVLGEGAKLPVGRIIDPVS